MGNGSVAKFASATTVDARPTEITDLYKACEVNNLEEAKRLLVNMPFCVINCAESNGSTALHVASSHGHADIVRLLVQEYGVIRHRRDANGMTAYRVAPNDEIRQIFHRPQTNDRYGSTVQGVLISAFAVFFPASKRPSPPWIHSESGWYRTRQLQYDMKKDKLMKNNPVIKIVSSLRRLSIPYLFETRNEAKALKLDVDRFIKPSHKQYKSACDCVKEFRETGNVEPLLRLYSFETPFYSKVGGPEHCGTLLTPLGRNSNTLSPRHFTGTSYRGLSMKKEDLEEYEEAMREGQERSDSVIVLASFASTSKDENLAKNFASARNTEDKVMVLFTCTFPKKCDTAIALYKVSESSLCISDFEDEEEVLLMPGTMFRVTKVDTVTDASLTHIYLTNVVPELHLEVAMVRSILNAIFH